MIKNKELRQIRLERKWTQGKAAQEIGIQQSYLSKLENDQAIASEDILLKICQAYNCNMRDIALSRTADNHSYTRSNILLYSSLSVLLLGIMLCAISYFGILENNTAYTYQLSDSAQKNAITVNFIVTDEFNGEKYTKAVGNSQVTYNLIGERSISPALNRLLNFLGLTLIFVGLALLLVRLINRKESKYT